MLNFVEYHHSARHLEAPAHDKPVSAREFKRGAIRGVLLGDALRVASFILVMAFAATAVIAAVGEATQKPDARGNAARQEAGHAQSQPRAPGATASADR